MAGPIEVNLSRSSSPPASCCCCCCRQRRLHTTSRPTPIAAKATTQIVTTMPTMTPVLVPPLEDPAAPERPELRELASDEARLLNDSEASLLLQEAQKKQFRCIHTGLYEASMHLQERRDGLLRKGLARCWLYA